MENRFTPFPDLTTEKLNLIELTLNELNDFHVLRSDPKVMKYIPRRLSATLDDTKELILSSAEKIKEGSNISWGIKLKNEKRLIGTIGFYRIQWENFRGEVGYILHPDYQGKGIMSEALQKVMGFGFGVLGFHTIEAVIDPNNKASENILLRNGFIKEGHFKENYFAEGKFYDSAVYTKFKNSLAT